MQGNRSMNIIAFPSETAKGIKVFKRMIVNEVTPLFTILIRSRECIFDIFYTFDINVIDTLIFIFTLHLFLFAYNIHCAFHILGLLLEL